METQRQQVKTSKPVVDLKAFLDAPAPANVASSCSSATATLLADLHSELGEGILYDDTNDMVVWTDIMGRMFHRLCLAAGPNATGTVETIELPKMLGSFALLSTTAKSETNVRNSDLLEGAYLFAWADGFQLYNPTLQKELSPMSEGEDVNPHKLPSRLNDGRCDPQGRRYICGGYYAKMQDVTMKVYSCHFKKMTDDDTSGDALLKLVHEPIIENVQCTNSLSFSPNGETMYFSDSPTKQIYSFDFNAEASSYSNQPLLSNKQLVYTLELDNAIPDGSCVDADGYIWSATWWRGVESSRVRRIDPITGKVVFEVHMPDSTSQVSCCCFGGKNLDILFITTAARGRDLVVKEPHAGGVYAIKLEGVRGRPEARFQVPCTYSWL